ncbi:prolyl aminopeptidase [Pseudonocardia eucalypti]|uniref:Proline iminopeptidase n=1 Tax=Pseudonocardia eucalypti TaxID=648755 RepID=A0ABP9PY91_9PSEU|nr:proline iminopeptidase [Pseudonocardia eucalypti]
MSREPYPPVEPYRHGLLDVGDGQRIYWECSGNPDGKPAVVLHGGPGGGSRPGHRQWFDPERYRIVLLDQRGCGRSTPSAATGDLSANTTAHLVADLERLREHLGINRWLVCGGSWGSTLGLAYAQAHPARVSELVLLSLVGSTRREIEWITREMGRVFPAEWARFRDGVPEAEREGNLSDAYRRLLADPDPAVRERAARDWCAWEDTHVATYPDHRPYPMFQDPAFRMVFARLVTHYWAHGAWLAEDALVRNADRLARTPGVLIHGRLDISSPAEFAWRLSRAWPDAELVLVGDGHSGPGLLAPLLEATDRFAGRR